MSEKRTNEQKCIDYREEIKTLKQQIRELDYERANTKPHSETSIAGILRVENTRLKAELKAEVERGRPTQFTSAEVVEGWITPIEKGEPPKSFGYQLAKAGVECPQNVDEDRDLDSRDLLSIVFMLCVTAVIITAIIFTS